MLKELGSLAIALLSLGLIGCEKEEPPQIVILEQGGQTLGDPATEDASFDGLAAVAAGGALAGSAAELGEAGHPTENTLVIPGTSLGPLDQNTSYEDLVRIYGEEALTPRTLTLQDGEKRLGTRISHKKGAQVTVIWVDNSRRGLREAREFGVDWKTPEGIHEGIGLDELEAAIGEFQVFGFGWANGGEVKIQGTRAAKYRNKLHLRVVPTRRYQEQLARLSGDTWYDSNDETLRAVKPVVRDMVVSFEAEGRDL